MTYTSAGRVGSFDFGRVIEGTFGVIGRNVVVFLLLSLLIVALPHALFWAAMASGTQGEAAGLYAYSALSWPIGMMTSFLLQAAVVHGAAADLGGRKAGLGECLRTGFAHVLPVLAIGVVVSVGVVFGLLLLIVPGAMLAAAWAVAVPARVVERKGVFAALGRSANLTRGHRWPIFGLFVILGLIGWVIGTVVGLLGIAVAGAGDANTLILSQGFLAGIGSAFGQLINSAGVAAIYHELRTGKEGVGAEVLASVFD